MTRTSRAARVSPSPPDRGHEQLIAALAPDFGAPQRPAPAPVPTLAAPLSHSTDALLVGAARIDRAGPVDARILLRALGWAPSHRLDLDTRHGIIVVASTPAGKHIVERRGAIALPAAARRMCGIEPGPPLVLAAAVRKQVLVIHPAATVAQLLTAHYRDLIGIPTDR